MGGERVFRPFITLLSVMAIFSIISVALMTQMVSSQRQVNSGVSEEPTQLGSLGNFEYHFINPLFGHNITRANVTQTMIHPKDSRIVFTDADHGDDRKYVQIIRNNPYFDANSNDMWKRYKDFVSVQRQTDEFFKANRWNGASISFETIIAAYDGKVKASLVNFQLSGENDTLVFETATNNSALIWANTFTLYYGWYQFREQKVDYWATITMILTAKIPGIDARVQFLISFIWVFSYIFIAFTLASRIFPTVGGG